MKSFIALFPALLLVFVCVASLNPAIAQEIAGVKCIVEGDRNAKEQFKAEYAGGEVYFCCPACAASFAKNNTAYQTQANHQLVLTKQFVQKACPIKGEAFDDTQTTKVGGVEVAFCCSGCKSQVDAAVDLPAKAELVFGKVAFERAFANVEDADAAKANLQLVASGQYVQKNCPLTGGAVDANKTVEVAGQTIACCCDSCQNKIKSASDDEKMAMVFGDEAFKKSFAKAKSEADSISVADAEDYSIAPDELPGPLEIR